MNSMAALISVFSIAVTLLTRVSAVPFSSRTTAFGETMALEMIHR